MTTRVVVVDDHPLFRDGLVSLVSSMPDMELVGSAADGPEVVDLVARVATDVVLMDLNLPTMSGVEATARIGKLADPPAILVVTMVDDDDTVVAALRSGARGYVLKGAPGEEIAAAIRTVAAGGAVFGAGVATQVLAMSTTGSPIAPTDFGDDLTSRERDVLALLADGASNAQIARTLDLSLKTVQNYVSRILDKLQLSDRTQAALHARDRRLR
ncbi:MAG: response regulator transcription factor [Frankiaceae bacterium]|nr:response regulator transcription factor [Frankiaceae bacterium]MBV9870420.1 response regulator transcription factor [Frankiaceae bacterium]